MRKYVWVAAAAALLLAVLQGCVQQEWCVTARVMFRETKFLYQPDSSSRDVADMLNHRESLSRYMKDTSLMTQAWKTVCDSSRKKQSALPWYQLSMQQDPENDSMQSTFALRMCMYSEDSSIELLNAWINVVIDEDRKFMETICQLAKAEADLRREEAAYQHATLTDSVAEERKKQGLYFHPDDPFEFIDINGSAKYRRMMMKLDSMEEMMEEAELVKALMATQQQTGIQRVTVLQSAGPETAE